MLYPLTHSSDTATPCLPPLALFNVWSDYSCKGITPERFDDQFYSPSTIKYALSTQSAYDTTSLTDLSLRYKGDTALVFERLSQLLIAEDEEAIIPSDYTMKAAQQLLNDTAASGRRSTGIPRAAISCDDDGRIRIQWIGHTKQLRLVVASSTQERHYLYHQHAGNYGIDWEITSKKLSERLDWYERN